MSIEEKSILYNKSFNFSLDIIKLYKNLKFTNHEYVLANQILRSGTSIGANISQSFSAQSTKDYLSKLYISLKECNETIYWLKLLIHSEIIDKKVGNNLIASANEIARILSFIIKKYSNKTNTVQQ